MSSFRLQTPRPRPAPPPLRLQSSTFNPPSTSASHQLLYDLPTPTSPTHSSQANTSTLLVSPTSPTSHSRGPNTPGRSRRTPPPSRARSVTPQPLHDDDLERFAAHCRAWYYHQDDSAGRLMTQTLATIPASQRAQYTRIQAAVRAAYHASVTARRTAEFQAHLSATQPGGSLMPHSRSDPTGPMAKRERRDRLERFVCNWCHMAMPGTKPFFEGLWAVMRLQVIPESLGGAGSKRIEWELDDAVFMESAGKDFMLEAIDVLKGVLGFEEKRSSRKSRSFRLSKDDNMSPFHSRTQSEPLSSQLSIPARQNNVSIASTTQTKRPRAPSDPFLDAPPLRQPLPSTTSRATSANVHTLATANTPEPLSPTTPPANVKHDFPGANAIEPRYQEQCEDQCFRIWTSPDLANPELVSLLAVFPTFILRRTLPRFSPSPAKRRPGDLEVGGDDDDLEEGRAEVYFGSGVLWVGNTERSDGWLGGWWERFLAWWRHILC